MKSIIPSVTILACFGTIGWAQVPAPPAPGLMADDVLTDDAEPLPRGPVHEAFAEPLDLVDEDPLVVPTEPPAAIEELPPEVKPEAEGALWIPGYWNWDDERKDYIWVSGVWRIPPQGRTWQQGRWITVPGGYRWVAGYWTNGVEIRAEDIPAPPPSLDQGPTSHASSSDFFWVPGVWRYQTNRYVWRPGFWSPCHDNWIWVPDYYAWEPNGYCFVPGYWDYTWEQRGLLFAPAVVNYRGLSPGFRYQPSVVVDLSNAFFHLWVRPNYSHYYFGDYYDGLYANYGFTPWYSYHQHYRRAYDPLFVHYNWRFRRDNVDLYHHMRARHRHLDQHVADRPPRRFDHGAVGAGAGAGAGSLYDKAARHRPNHGQNLAYRPKRGERLPSGRQGREALRDNVLRTQRDLVASGAVPRTNQQQVNPTARTPQVLTNRRDLERSRGRSGIGEAGNLSRGATPTDKLTRDRLPGTRPAENRNGNTGRRGPAVSTVPTPRDLPPSARSRAGRGITTAENLPGPSGQARNLQAPTVRERLPIANPELSAGRLAPSTPRSNPVTPRSIQRARDRGASIDGGASFRGVSPGAARAGAAGPTRDFGSARMRGSQAPRAIQRAMPSTRDSMGGAARSRASGPRGALSAPSISRQPSGAGAGRQGPPASFSRRSMNASGGGRRGN